MSFKDQLPGLGEAFPVGIHPARRNAQRWAAVSKIGAAAALVVATAVVARRVRQRADADLRVNTVAAAATVFAARVNRQAGISGRMLG